MLQPRYYPPNGRSARFCRGFWRHVSCTHTPAPQLSPATLQLRLHHPRPMAAQLPRMQRCCSQLKAHPTPHHIRSMDSAAHLLPVWLQAQAAAGVVQLLAQLLRACVRSSSALQPFDPSTAPSASASAVASASSYFNAVLPHLSLLCARCLASSSPLVHGELLSYLLDLSHAIQRAECPSAEARAAWMGALLTELLPCIEQVSIRAANTIRSALHMHPNAERTTSLTFGWLLLGLLSCEILRVDASVQPTASLLLVQLLQLRMERSGNRQRDAQAEAPIAAQLRMHALHALSQLHAEAEEEPHAVGATALPEDERSEQERALWLLLASTASVHRTSWRARHATRSCSRSHVCAPVLRSCALRMYSLGACVCVCVCVCPLP